MEPFKIKMVEPIHFTTYNKRKDLIKQANYNPFLLRSTDITIDLLTDSGTGAMSQDQWSGMMTGDETYAGARSFFRFKDVIDDIFGYKYILPVHQGRAAERILFSAILSPGQIVPNNTHFDTTKANVERLGAIAMNLPTTTGEKDGMFKGNMDITKLKELLREKWEKIPLVMLTITNNGGGGQPVSMANIREVYELCQKYKIPMFFDACRFAENCYFIKQREPNYSDIPIRAIIRELFSYGDGAYMSAKKDAIVNTGGILATNVDDLYEKFKHDLIATEGFITYGGLAGRDLDAIAIGLLEGTEEHYLKYRIDGIQKFGEILKSHGIPIIEPTGGHAIYIDALKVCDHLPREQYPAWALCNALYIEGGIRAVEIGGVMFGEETDENVVPLDTELVRLAVPRRVYTQSHYEYVGTIMKNIMEKKHRISGFRMLEGTRFLRHFTVKMEPILGNVFSCDD